MSTSKKAVDPSTNSKIPLKLLQDFVLIQIEKAAEKSAGGIVLPERTRDSVQTRVGTIIAVGPGTTSITANFLPTKRVVDEKVIFDPAAGTLLQYQNVEYVLVHERDVIAVIPK